MSDSDTKTRHTGAAAALIARARDTAHAKVVAGNQSATDQQVAAQQRAASQLNLAHGQAGEVLGQNLQAVFLAAQQRVLGVDPGGHVTATIAATDAAAVAVDPGARRVYWTQTDAAQAAPQRRQLPEPESRRPLRAGEVALYRDIGFAGAMWVLSASVSNFIAIEGLNDQVSSIRVGPGTSVTLYEHVGYQGRQQTFNADSASLIGSTIGNDAASSLRIAVGGAVAALTPLSPGEVALYEHVGYGGRCWILSATTSDFLAVEGLNDQVSSIRLGPGTSATLCEHINFQGRQQTFTADNPNLIGSAIGNDAASSLRVTITPPTNLLPLQTGEVALYEHVNYSGKAWFFNRDISDFPAMEGLNDQVSSIKVGPGTSVTLYEHVGYQGRQQTFTADNPNLIGSTIGNDTASSLRISASVGGASLFAAGVDGTGAIRLAGLPLVAGAPAGAGAVALDLGRQRLFWVTSDGTLYGLAPDGGTPQRMTQIPGANARFWSLALDTTGQRIYWGTPTALGWVGYDGAGAQTLLANLGASAAVAVAVDAQNQRLYWNDGRGIQRSALAAFQAQPLFSLKGSGAGLALDGATQMLYWIDQGTLYRADMDGAGQPEAVATLPEGSITGLALLTISGAASDRLADAHAARQTAQTDAQQRVAQAHEDATTRRQAAHNKLKDTHNQAAGRVAAANQTAAQRRQAAQQNLQDAHTQAAARQGAAGAAADLRRQQARADAQTRVAAARQEAASRTADAQAKLDEARRKQQQG